MEVFEIELFWHLTELFWYLNVCKQKLYLYLTELFEIQFGVKWPEKGWHAIKQKSTNEFSLTKVHSLNVKTVLFQTIQFSIGTQFQYQKQFYFKQFNLT